MAKQELRLFVSSTFRDLQAERDELVKRVFPRIRAECNRRGVTFTEIDLRWGITQQEARSGQVVRICLEEIDRCAPYFIGIIGDRYGWIPTRAEVEKDTRTLPAYPWLDSFLDEQRSIIDMEFAYGATMRPGIDSAFFYRRTRSQSLATTGGLAPDEESRLASLTADLRKHKLPLRSFRDAQTFGKQVYRDLMSVIERDWPMTEARSELENERYAHDAFARVRTRSYIADPRYEQIFDSFIEGDGAPMVFSGKSGLGKSALLAHLAIRQKELDPTSFVIAHFVGADRTSSASSIIQHIMLEIKERCSLEDEIPASEDELRDALPAWLAKVQQEKLIILIDALDQLTGVASELLWLPSFIPSNVRLVLSSIPTPALDTLAERKWKIVPVKPLPVRLRRQIIREYLKQYHKSLTRTQTSKIAERRQTASPLFLRTLLEELRVFGVFEHLGKHLSRYLEAADESALFQRVLARLEQDHGKATVRSVLSAIWASRMGLSESELLAITGIPRLRLSPLLIALEYHLMQRDGLNVFFHTYLREAVRSRYLKASATRTAAHSKIAEYFSSQPFDARRRDEEPWQWLQAKQLDRLRDAIIEPGMQHLFAAELHEYDIIPYLRALGVRETLERMVDDVLVAPATDCYDRTIVLNKLITAASEHALNRKLLEHCLATLPKRSRTKRLKIQEELGIALAQLGDYRASSEMMRRVLAAKEKQFGSESPEVCNALDGLTLNSYHLQDFDQAAKYALRSLENTPASASSERISRLQNLAAIEHGRENIEVATRLCEEALQLAIKKHGAKHPVVAQAEGNLGQMYYTRGQFDEALDHFNKVLSYYRVTFGELHEESLVFLNNIAACLQDSGRTQEAIENYKTSFNIAQRVYGVAHIRTAVAGLNLGQSLSVAGIYDKALALFEQWVPVKRLYLGQDNPSLKRSETRLEELRVSVSAMI